MQLPDFIKRMLGFAESAEKHFIAAQELAQAKQQISDLQAKLDQAVADAAEFPVEIKGLAEKLQTAQEQVNSRDAEIKNLQAQLEAARGKANEAIAAQGLALEQIPPSSPAGASSVEQRVNELRREMKTASPSRRYEISEQIKTLLKPGSTGKTKD